MDDVAHNLFSILDPVSFKLSKDITESQREELTVEVQFYGLLRLMMPTAVPYYAQEQTGVALLQRACVAGTMGALRSSVAAARALVFEMGSTNPWLTDEFHDLRYVITDRVVNGAPVWAAEGGDCFMYRAGNGQMLIGSEASCAAGNAVGCIYNTVQSPDVLSPTQLLSNNWMSNQYATLGPQFASAAQVSSDPEHIETEMGVWVKVPDMRVTAVHGLDDAEPAMAAALRHLAALTGDE